MMRPEPSKSTARAAANRQQRGRSGGRSGGAGYDYQDVYIALQLTKLLMGDRDPLIEVLWEKKALELKAGAGAEQVWVDDAIVRVRSGRCIYVQVKQAGPRGGWSLREFARSGLAVQFWRQWLSKAPDDRPKTILRIASAADVTPLKMLIDVALRSRTPAELLSDESSEETLQDLGVLAKALSIPLDKQELLEFLKSLQAEQLPAAEDLEGVIIRSLSPFGVQASEVARHLIRLVARSKHVGPSARSAHDRDTLLTALREQGVADESLIAAGLLTSGRVHEASFWDAYRAEVVKSYRTFRVYGLNVERVVFADLPSLFVPLKLAPISDRKKAGERAASKHRERRLLTQSVLADSRDLEADEPVEMLGALELSVVLREKRRFALIGGPGSGKTTTLKWLALVCALPGDEGRETRSKCGLPADPLLPLFVRFRRLADRIRARGLDGIAGRVGLVAEFLAAELEAGLAGKLPSKREALEIAEELLASDNCIFLFDALDEVPDPGVRARLFDAVADLMQCYPKPRVVISSRPYAFREERAPIELASFEPLPLNRSGRRVFARQWYRAVRTHLGDGLTDGDAEGRADDLVKSADGLADLAENPLLLSILALVHFNRQGLPVERSTLYDHATLAMLGHWERDPAGRDLGDGVIPADWQPTLRLPEALVRRVVEWLACDVQHRDQGGGEFSREVAIDALVRGLETAASMSVTQAVDRAPLLLQLLAERSGIIQERSPGVFTFVHLSFQDYLAARWFVGAGEQGLSELAALANEARHAEVVRFAVAILAADQRAEADERALRLVREVATKDAVLAAACLFEAPRLQLSENAVQQLARRVWAECASMWGRHYHPTVASRLVWTLLERSARADELLLEFLTLGSHGRRGPMEGEMELYLLVSRPPIPISGRLEWVLRQLERAGEGGSWMPLWSIAALLMIEGRSAEPKDHLAALVRLLGEEHWNQAGRGTLGERAERILHDLAGGEARQDVRHALETAIGASEQRDASENVACGAAKLLLSLRLAASVNPSDVLVQRGLKARYRHTELCRDLRVFLDDERHREATMAALERGLTSDNDEVRRGSARVLREAGIAAPPLALLLDDDEQEEERFEKIRSLAADPSRKESTIAALAEALWDEREAVSWRAAQALLDEGCSDTPGLVQALVRVGLASEGLRTKASGDLQRLRQDARRDLSIKGALLDGLRNECHSVATASAMLLTDIGEARGEARVLRITKALLRDSKQVSNALPRLQYLLGQHAVGSVVKAIGEYIDRKDVDAQTASACAQLMVDGNHLNTPHLAKALVLSGLADEDRHDRVITYIKRLLDDPKLVTDARKALSEGLQSDTPALAWGSARCLWEVGSRTDAHLASAIIRSGLTNTSRRETARAWMLELLGQPRTAAKALSALEEAASELGYRDTAEASNVAWEISQCLLAAQIFEAEHLARVVVAGGLSVRERHDEIVRVVQGLLAAKRVVAEAVEQELWSAVSRRSRKSNNVAALGAARVLIEAGCPSVREVMAGEDHKTEERAVALIMTLLSGATDKTFASEALRRLLIGPESGARTRRALVLLLKDEDDDTAYAAARCLVGLGDTSHRTLPAALVRGGLTQRERRAETMLVLDELSTHPLVAAALREALQQAVWGEREEQAWSAAVYLMDRLQITDAGVARGLVFGGVGGHGPAQEADKRVRTLLVDPASRDGVVNALRVLLLGEDRGYMLNVASLLIVAGEPLGDRILAEYDSDFAARHSPFVPLATLALTGRVDEARERARALGLRRLLHLLGDEPLPCDSALETVSVVGPEVGCSSPVTPFRRSGAGYEPPADLTSGIAHQPTKSAIEHRP